MLFSECKGCKEKPSIQQQQQTLSAEPESAESQEPEVHPAPDPTAETKALADINRALKRKLSKAVRVAFATGRRRGKRVAIGPFSVGEGKGLQSGRAARRAARRSTEGEVAGARAAHRAGARPRIRGGAKTTAATVVEERATRGPSRAHGPYMRSGEVRAASRVEPRRRRRTLA